MNITKRYYWVKLIQSSEFIVKTDRYDGNLPQVCNRQAEIIE